jgi:hypothetical protein
MPLFSEFMSDLSQRRGIRRMPDGSRVTYRLRLHGSAAITVMTDELDPSAGARVISEAWPVPPAAGAYGEFMRTALRFNRSALHHLDAGIVQDPANPGQYRLTWFVPAVEQPGPEWSRQLRLFGKLTDQAWKTMPSPGQSAGPRRAPVEDAGQVIFMP